MAARLCRLLSSCCGLCPHPEPSYPPHGELSPAKDHRANPFTGSFFSAPSGGRVARDEAGILSDGGASPVDSDLVPEPDPRFASAKPSSKGHRRAATEPARLLSEEGTAKLLPSKHSSDVYPRLSEGETSLPDLARPQQSPPSVPCLGQDPPRNPLEKCLQREDDPLANGLPPPTLQNGRAPHASPNLAITAGKLGAESSLALHEVSLDLSDGSSHIRAVSAPSSTALKSTPTSSSSVASSSAAAHTPAAAPVLPPAVVPQRTPLTPDEERSISRLSNRNAPGNYDWLRSLLERITANTVSPVTNLENGASLQPMFVVGGACPNSFCGMQAVLYALGLAAPASSPIVDFWWVKPRASDPTALEAATLNRHGKGPHKNDPGRSRALYVQFADLFTGGSGAVAVGGGKLSFGLQSVGGVTRAYIEQLENGHRYYIYLIWQENWTSNPFASSKFIIGKIVYQRDPTSPALFARPYAYRDGVLSVPSDGVEEAVEDVIPDARLKLNCMKP